MLARLREVQTTIWNQNPCHINETLGRQLILLEILVKMHNHRMTDAVAAAILTLEQTARMTRFAIQMHRLEVTTILESIYNAASSIFNWRNIRVLTYSKDTWLRILVFNRQI